MFADALHVVRVTVADAADRDASDEIEIFVPIDVINCAALRAIDCHL